VQVTSRSIVALKRHAQEFSHDQRSQDDTWISYLETLEQQDQDNLMLAQMLAREGSRAVWALDKKPGIVAD
jgi:hypothetical protein